MPPRRTIIIFSQVFVPDPASVGQHEADVAFELVRRGWRVRVYTSRRGYDDPTLRYAARETLNGVEIIRIPLASFGKKSILTRIIGTASFMAQVALRGLFARDFAGIFFSTSPPLIGIIATLVHKIRGVPIVYWAMDLNPDQLLAMGKLTPSNPATHLLEAANRMILRNSSRIIALDRFMADRLRPRADLDRKLTVIPPWPHGETKGDANLYFDPAANPFRARHNLDGKFVVMYSGNHSPSNPLQTVLEAAKRLKDDDQIRFLFVGGGIGKKEVEAFARDNQLPNILCLPYQPLADLPVSLSAADAHVVSLGENMVGIIHPCKVYGAMAVARPVLFFGPRPSHIADLLDQHEFGLHIEHGDVQAAVAAIHQLRDMPENRRAEMGQIGQRLLNSTLSQDILCGKICDDLEAVFGCETYQS
jgi:colanic acid biosynthesis glycosyl transferase WcaI